MLRRVSAEAAIAGRQVVEEALSAAVSEVLRTYVADVRRAALSALPTALRASVAEALPDGEMPTLGALAGRWAAGVDAGVLSAVTSAFERTWRRYTDADLSLDSPAYFAMQQYVGAVRDRLVRGTYFGVTVYDESFESVRRALAQAVAEDWTRPQLAQRIAAELSWETDGSYWRGALAEVDSQIDAILDPMGEPGNPVREAARLGDARVQALRDQRNIAIRHLDAEKSVWQTRAMLIARTEATGAYNYGALQAFGAEGVERKVWLSANQPGRTRLTHMEASDQKVRVDAAFLVGGARLQFPGDPAGPVAEVANCRCIMIAGD